MPGSICFLDTMYGPNLLRDACASVYYISIGSNGSNQIAISRKLSLSICATYNRSPPGEGGVLDHIMGGGAQPEVKFGPK